MKSIRDWQTETHGVSLAHGWWDNDTTLEQRIKTIPTKLCLIHSEVSEALELYRDKDFTVAPKFDENGKPIGFDCEMVDIVIRVFDLCGALGIDLEDAMEAKNAYNRKRERLHGGKRC